MRRSGGKDRKEGARGGGASLVTSRGYERVLRCGLLGGDLESILS